MLIFLKTNVKYRRHSRFTHCRLQIMTSVTSINNYSEFTVKQRKKIVAGSNSSEGGVL